ncbi:hypothetical protein [Desulfosediminicola sp.]
MITASDFLLEVSALQDEVRALNDIADARTVAEVAARLEALNYAPTVVLPLERFLRIRKLELLSEIEKIIVLSDEEVYEMSPGDPRCSIECKLRYIVALVYYFRQLVQLRKGNPDAWDEVDELYVHD